MTYSRRDFLKAGATLTAAAALPARLLAERALPEPSDAGAWRAELRALAFRAVEAARSAGASYADVRLTRTRHRTINRVVTSESVDLAFGVRALVRGYWGFASGPTWSPEEAVRLGREAVAQARANTIGQTRIVELGTIPIVDDGHWVNTTDTDPFTVSLDQLHDMVLATDLFRVEPWRFAHQEGFSQFRRQERAFASSEGSFCTQLLFRTTAGTTISVGQVPGRWVSSDILPIAARGLEYLTTAPLAEELRRLVPLAEELDRLPLKPVEVGRFDAVFDARSTALLLEETLGAATELDRAMGYEANAGGTSYLRDPIGMLDTESVAAPAITVSANRSRPGGLATVKWDDEGVAPEDFTLVKEGVLAGFQTTRESAAWIAPWYEKTGRPVRSHGCAAVDSALDVPMAMPPNLRLVPGREETSHAELVRGLERGIEVSYIAADVDFQCLNGFGQSALNTFSFVEVRKGKRTALLKGLGFLFRSPELWKSVTALGGPESMRASAHVRRKGEPRQSGQFTVDAPPMRVKQLTVIDPTRKA